MPPAASPTAEDPEARDRTEEAGTVGPAPEVDVDVLIVGAGLSGIGAACRLRQLSPGLTWAVVEARDDLGGTWDLFRYPGIRSDSDMFTFGFPFRPWTGDRWFGDGASILAYLRETAEEHGVTERIRYGHKIRTAAWSSDEGRWTVTAEVGPDAEARRLRCRFLFLCAGYYSYEHGHVPDIAGRDDFEGLIVHPQEWPEGLDCAGQRVVVIGSGATAVTLVPALTETAGHVTMLQRSPTYVTALPSRDPLTALVQKVLPPRWSHRVIRARNAVGTQIFYQVSRRRPEAVKRALRRMAEHELGGAVPVDPHFTPTYDPWDQRVCVVPDGDLFRVLREGRASIVTDHIDHIDATGIRLSSGDHLDADVIVTATGLELLAAGGITFTVDGDPVDSAASYVYKGWGLSGVPNAAMSVGYTNASWTLRSDLTAREVCALLNHMERHGHDAATPTPSNPHMPGRPLLDLAAGYIQRAVGSFPRQGDRAPWVMRHNYLLDALSTRFGDVTDSMTFTRRGTPVPRPHGGEATPRHTRPEELVDA